MNKPNNFSNDKPTQKNHYSIRKFTVGTASIIVGSFLFFGQAHAEEGTGGNTWQREAVGTVNTAGQPSTTSQDQNNQAGTGTPAATQTGQDGAKTNTADHQGQGTAEATGTQTNQADATQTNPSPNTTGQDNQATSTPQGTQTAGTGQTAPTTATGDTQAKPHAETADQGNGATVTPSPQNDATSPAASTKPGQRLVKMLHLNQVLLKTIVLVKVLKLVL